MAERMRTIMFARLMRAKGQASLLEESFSKDLRESLSPARRISRYGRTWRFSRPRRIQRRFIVGKLGFARSSREEAVIYDPVQEDFLQEERASEQLNFSHFVTDLEGHLLAFEERPPDIRRQSFLGAFRALLQESPFAWEVEPLIEAQTFNEWLDRVETVHSFRAHLRRPNPQWRERTARIREMIESTGADRVTLDAKADEDSSLRVPDTILEDAVEHATGGYARIRALGTTEGKPTTFDSTRSTRSMHIREELRARSPAIFRKIIDALKELPRGK